MIAQQHLQKLEAADRHHRAVLQGLRNEVLPYIRATHLGQNFRPSCLHDPSVEVASHDLDVKNDV